MTDEELAAGLNIDVSLVPKITPEKRAMYERLLRAADELLRYQVGEISTFSDRMIVCGEHK
jgi:hypothetical protein